MTRTSKTGRTSLVCLTCDNIDPMETDAVKWANSGLANSERPYCGGYSRRNKGVLGALR
jgi:hypothetical protein